MAKSKNKVQQAEARVSGEKVYAATSRPGLALLLLIAAGIAVVTWFVLSPCLNNQFTDWDDAGYFVNNPIVRDISADGLKKIFSEPVMGNYHPFTMLTYALEYNAVELEPSLYHIDSLLMHILASLLVFWFITLLTGRYIAGTVTALLFALHPMHVESAVWIAGRKDLLYCIFFIGSCITHIYYIRSRHRRSMWYILTLLLFLFAVLSKPVAVVLPLVLLLIDLYEQRRSGMRLVMEKTPHLLISLLFGIISFSIQHGGGAMSAQKIHYSLIERIALGCFAFCTYIWKSLIPVHLCAFYPYPANASGSLPFSYYIYVIISIAGIYGAWKYFRKNITVTFGLSFFLITIFLLLQFIPVGEAIMADRYSYVPYTGLFFIIGWFFSELFTQNSTRSVKYIALAAAFLYTSILAYGSYNRTKVWYDATTLWTDEINKEPDRAPLAYNNLGYIYFNRKNMATDAEEKRMAADSALYLLHKAAELEPTLYNALQGLGMLYYMRGDFETSATYFRVALGVRPIAESYSDYGNILIQLGKTDSALINYNEAVKLNGSIYLVWLNRAKLLKDLKRYDEAKSDIDRVIALDPAIGEAYYVRSYYYAAKGETALALQDIDKAISLGYQQINTEYYQGLKNK